jgi:hypothetical protein
MSARRNVSEPSRQTPEPVGDGDTTGAEGGGGGWSRPEQVRPETRKKEPRGDDEPPKD